MLGELWFPQRAVFSQQATDYTTTLSEALNKDIVLFGTGLLKIISTGRWLFDQKIIPFGDSYRIQFT